MYPLCTFYIQDFLHSQSLAKCRAKFCSLLVVVMLNLQSYIWIQSVFNCFTSSISWDRRINVLLIGCSSDKEKIVYVINISDLINESVFTSKNLLFCQAKMVSVESYWNAIVMVNTAPSPQRMVPVSPWLMTWPLHSHITTVSSLGIDEDVGSN